MRKEKPDIHWEGEDIVCFIPLLKRDYMEALQTEAYMIDFMRTLLDAPDDKIMINITPSDAGRTVRLYVKRT